MIITAIVLIITVFIKSCVTCPLSSVLFPVHMPIPGSAIKDTERQAYLSSKGLQYRARLCTG